jgi:hypothetical protein
MAMYIQNIDELTPVEIAEEALNHISGGDGVGLDPYGGSNIDAGPSVDPNG